MSTLLASSPLLQPTGLERIRKNSLNDSSVNQLSDIPHDSEAFIQHAISIASFSIQANNATTIEELTCIQVAVNRAILYSPWGSSHETDSMYSVIHKCCDWRIGNKRAKETEKESSMYRIFRKSPQKYIPGAVIVKRKTLNKAIPDFFLIVNKELHIAEFKVDTFKKRDLYQLKEYMEIYDAKWGYAVAPELLCPLPANVSFVRFFPEAVRQALMASQATVAP